MIVIEYDINTTIAGNSTTRGILTPSDCTRNNTVIAGFNITAFVNGHIFISTNDGNSTTNGYEQSTTVTIGYNTTISEADTIDNTTIDINITIRGHEHLQ